MLARAFPPALCVFVAAGACLSAAPEPETAPSLWLRGQQAMRDGDAAQAIRCYEQSLAIDPTLSRNHLSLAAGHVALGRQEQAAQHLARYLDAQPDHHTVRGYYAELLLRLGKPEPARVQFERFVAGIQANEALANQHLVHCHSRLMEIAELAEDIYGEHLHRGIGLYLLAQQRARVNSSESELSVEGLLCQAAGELMLARRERPDEARPCWYLHEVWSRLAQAQPAARWLRAAEAASLGSELTPHEHARLQLACRQLTGDLARK